LGKYCDLDSVATTSPAPSEISFVTNDAESPGIINSNLIGPMPTILDLLPFGRHDSTKICLKSAFNIVQTFNELPFPNPTGLICAPPVYLASTSRLPAPRLMPSLACCAMQCTYTLVMVHSRIGTTYSENTRNPLVEGLLMRLRMGLTSISTIFENYAMAFEALGGMRGKKI
jgi:hypothetical protein